MVILSPGGRGGGGGGHKGDAVKECSSNNGKEVAIKHRLSTWLATPKIKSRSCRRVFFLCLAGASARYWADGPPDARSRALPCRAAVEEAAVLRGVTPVGTSAATPPLSARRTPSSSPSRRAGGRGCGCSWRRISPSGNGDFPRRPASRRRHPRSATRTISGSTRPRNISANDCAASGSSRAQDAAHKPILLVARDPRDVMVSLFFHLKKRGAHLPGRPARAAAPSGLRRATGGRYHEPLAGGMERPGRMHILRYEDARRDPAAAFAGGAAFPAAGRGAGPGRAARAVEIASFENMRRLEAGDLGGPRSGIRRRSQEGGAPPLQRRRSRQLTRCAAARWAGTRITSAPPDIEFLNRALERLDPRFGYTPG